MNLVSFVVGVEIKCLFGIEDFGVLENLYTCTVQSSNKKSGCMVHTISGSHRAFQSNINVAVLSVYETRMKAGWKFIPNYISFFFPNLKVLQIAGASLDNISQENFEGFNNLTILGLQRNNLEDIDQTSLGDLKDLQSLTLSFNEIKQVHNDSFYKLPSLSALSLEQNRIEHLPGNLFRHNLRLKELNLSDNKIIDVGSNIFDHLTQLHTVDFSDNKCINFMITEHEDLGHMVGKLKDKCNSKAKPLEKPENMKTYIYR